MKLLFLLSFLGMPLSVFAAGTEPDIAHQYQQQVGQLQQEMDKNIEEISNVAVLVNQARDESDLERLKLLVRSIGEKIRIINERKRLVEDEYRMVLEVSASEKQLQELVRIKETLREEIRRSPEKVTPEVVENARVEGEMAQSNAQFERLQFQEVETEEEILRTESEENEIAREQARQELTEGEGTEWEKKARQNEFFALEQKTLLLEAKSHLLKVRKELLETKDRANQLSVELKELRLASLKEKAARQRGEEAFARFEELEQKTQAEIQRLEQDLDSVRSSKLDLETQALVAESIREKIQQLRLDLSQARLEVSVARTEEQVESPLIRPNNLQNILLKEKKTLESLEAEQNLMAQRRSFYELKRKKWDEASVFQTESETVGEIVSSLRQEEEVSKGKIESQKRLVALVEGKIASWGGTRLWYRHRYAFDLKMFTPLIRNLRTLPARIPSEIQKMKPVDLKGHRFPRVALLSGLAIVILFLALGSLGFKRWTQRRIAFLRTKAEGDYALVMVISLLRLVGRNLFPAVLTAGMIGVHSLLGWADFIGLPIFSLLGAVIGYFVANSLLQEFFDPRGKKYRLLPLEETASLFIYRWLHLSLLFLIIPLLVHFFLIAVGAPDAIRDLSWLTVKAGLLIAATVGLFAKRRVVAFPHPERGLGRFFYRLFLFSYYPGVIGSIALLGLFIAGYQNFSHAVFVKAGWILLVLSASFVIRRVLADQIRRHVSSIGERQLERGLISLLNLIVAVAGLAILFHLLGVEVRSAFGGSLWVLLTRAWTTVGGTPLTILSVGKGLIVFLLFIFSSRLICGLLDEKVYPKFLVDEGIRSLINTIIHYSLIFFGLLSFLSVVGIRLTTLAVFAGALGVGLGFGLQNIANNFVSGLILLFERPVKKGDYVQVGNQFGVVERVGGRSTLVTTRDNVTLIVPNSELIAMQVTNWSHRDPRTRMRVPVSVAYGTDVATVDRCLYEVAKESSQVLPSPAPEVIFREFGESALNFELLVWVDNPLSIGGVHDQLNRAIEKKFRALGIEIPFPQRDVHFRTSLDLLKPS